MFKRLTPTAVALAGLALFAGAPVQGQDVKYTTVSRAEFGGALGRMLKLTGAGDPVTEVTYIKGNRLRSDDDKQSSTITDFGDGMFTWLDHEAKTYHSMTFAQMMTAAQQFAGAAGDSAQGQEPPAEDEPQYTYDIKASTDRTGKKQKIQGSQAEQVLITVEIEATEVNEEDDSTLAGTLILLSDQWMSTEFPGYQAMQRVEMNWHDYWQANSAGGDAGGMDQATAADPRIGAAMEKLAEQLKDLEGVALRSTTHFVLVPPEVKFDRNKALKDADKSLADDAAGAAADEAAKSAQNAVSGLTGGLFGSKTPKEPKPEQSTFIRIKSEVTGVETAPLAGELFKAPPDYTESKPQGIGS
jgi:hypothetical protein